MSGPEQPPRHSTGHIVLRVVAAIIAAISGAFFLLLAWTVTRSRFGPPQADPHGYALIFGTRFALCVGLVMSMALPFAFPREVRVRVIVVGWGAYVLVSAALVAMLVTAT